MKCLAIPCDVTNSTAVQEAADQVIKAFGKVDILINNAGSGGQTPVLEMSEAEWMQIIELDLNAVFRVCKAFGRHMVEAKYGRVINVASMYGVVAPVLPSSNYAAAKAGVINFSRTLANEWAPYNVTVNALCPGFFVTELTADTLESPEFMNSLGALVPLKRAGREGELNAALIYLASDEASYTTGTATVVDGGYSAL